MELPKYKYYISLDMKDGSSNFTCIAYEKVLSGFIFYQEIGDNEIQADVFNFTDIKHFKIEKIECEVH